MPERSVRVMSRERGMAAQGPGFYVWDHDAGQLLRWAAELTDAVLSSRVAASRPVLALGPEEAGEASG